MATKHETEGAGNATSGVHQLVAIGRAAAPEAAVVKLSAKSGFRHELLGYSTGMVVSQQKLVQRGTRLDANFKDKPVLDIDDFYQAQGDQILAAQYLVEEGIESLCSIDGGLADGGLATTPLREVTLAHSLPLAGNTPSQVEEPASDDGLVVAPLVAAATLGGGHLIGSVAAAGIMMAAAGAGGAPAPVALLTPGTTVVKGAFVGGPVLPGNGLKASVYDLAGRELGSVKVKDDGSFWVDIGPHVGGILVKVIDLNDAPDYRDEGSRENKSLGKSMVFMALAEVVTANTTITVNINAATTVAAVKAGLRASDGGGSVSGRSDAEKLAVIASANMTVAKVVGLSGPLVQEEALPTVTLEGDASLSANALGRFLAAVSGIDVANSGDMVSTVNALAAGLSGVGSAAALSPSTQAALINGAVGAGLSATAMAIQLDSQAVSRAQSFVPSAVASLEPTAAVFLSAAQIQAINDSSLIPGPALSVLLVPLVQAIDMAQVRQLTPNQLASLTRAQIASLKQEQLQVLTVQQVVALSPGQLSALEPSQLAQNILLTAAWNKTKADLLIAQGIAKKMDVLSSAAQNLAKAQAEKDSAEQGTDQARKDTAKAAYDLAKVEADKAKLEADQFYKAAASKAALDKSLTEDLIAKVEARNAAVIALEKAQKVKAEADIGSDQAKKDDAQKMLDDAKAARDKAKLEAEQATRIYTEKAEIDRAVEEDLAAKEDAESTARKTVVDAQKAKDEADRQADQTAQDAAQKKLDAAKNALTIAATDADDAAKVAADQVSNAAPWLSVPPSSVSFQEKVGQDDQSNSKVVAPGVIAYDSDGLLISATLSITNAQPGDVLLFTDTTAVTGSYANGVMTLSAKAGQTPSNGQFQAAIASVRFNNTSDSPALVDREIRLVVSDGHKSSLTNTQLIGISAVNDPPTVSVGTQSAVLVEAGGANNTTAGTASATIVLTKADLDGLASYDTSYLMSNGWNAVDSGLTYAKAGTYGTATLTISSGVVSYVLDNSNMATQALTAEQRASDTFGSVLATDGEAKALSSAIRFSIVGGNDTPMISGGSSNVTFIEMAGTDTGANAQTINNTLVLSDVDDNALASARVTITNAQTGDQLCFTDDASLFSAVSDSDGVGLQFSPSDGLAHRSLAEFQALLRSIKFNNNSDTPDTSAREVSFIVSDGKGNSNTFLQTVNVVTTPPSVTVVALTGAAGSQNNTLNEGDVLTVTVGFNEAVTVTGTPQLTLNIGGIAVLANYASGSGGTSLGFSSTIAAGQNDVNGISIPANALSLNGGSIKDIAGNTASLAHVQAADNASYTVDTLVPTLTISSNKSSLKGGEQATMTFSFSEDPGASFMWDGSTGNVTVSGGTLGAISGSGLTRTATFTPTPNLALGSASISVSAGAYRDAAGNPGDAGQMPSVRIDTLAPTVIAVSDATAAVVTKNPISFTVTFSEALVGMVSTSNFTATHGVVSSVVAGANSSYTVVVQPSAGLARGDVTLRLVGTGLSDALGNAVANADLTVLDAQAVDTLAPSTSINSAALGLDTAANGTSNSDFITKASDQDLSGTLSANLQADETVLVSLDGGGTWQAATATVGQNTWRLANQTLSANNTLKVKVQDSAGNDGAAYSQAYVLDTILPVLSISDVAVDNVINASKKAAGITISGTSDAEPGQSVSVVWGGVTQIAAVGSNGQWQSTFSAADVPADISSSTIIARVYDVAGNLSLDASRDVRIDTTAPTISISVPLTAGAGVAEDADNILNKNELDAVPAGGTLAVSGTTDAELGRPVWVQFNYLYFSGTVTAGAGSNVWTVQIPKADLLNLKHGASYPLQATVSDAAGNLSLTASKTLQVKLAPPDVPTVTLDSTNDTTPVITGWAQKINASVIGGYSALEAGDALTVTVDSQVYTLIVGSSASSPAGLSYDSTASSWSLDVTGRQVLAQGVFDVGVSVNAVGYAQPKTDISSDELVIKTDLPVLVIDSIATDNILNIAESQATVRISGSVFDNSPGNTVNTAAGRTLSLSLGGKTYSNVLVQSDGSWAVQVPAADVALLNGYSYDASASYTSLYGNVGELSRSLAVDLVRPALPNAALKQDTGGADPIPVTANGEITVPTNTEAGAALQYRVTKDQGAAGNWTGYIAPATDGSADGSYKIEVRQTDAAGNASALQTINYVLDTRAPTVGTVTDGTSASLTNEVITFTVTFNEALTGTVATDNFTATDGTVSSVTQVGASNAYTVVVIPTAGLASGSVALSLVGTGLSDAAGNVPANADLSGLDSQSIDTKAPAVSSISDAATASVSKDAVNLTVTFDEALVGTPTPSNFSANYGTVESVTRVGTSNAYTVKVMPTAGIASAQLTLSLVGTGLSDAVGNSVQNANLSSLGSQGIDTLAPTLSITSDKSALKIGETATITFTFSEDPGSSFAWDGSTGDVTLANGTLGATSGAGLTRTAIFTPTPNLASGNAGIAVAAGSYTDAVGNSGGAGASPLISIDTLAPTLSSVTAPATTLGAAVAGTPGNSVGETITLTITFDGNVNGLTSGTDNLVFTVGGIGASATWAGTAGTRTRTLTYTVAAGQGGQAAIDEAALKAALVAGISDAAGNAFAYTANGGNIANIDIPALPLVDTTEPTIGTVAFASATGRQNSTLNEGDVLTVTVSFSEAVTVSGTPQLALTIGSATVQANYASGSGGTSLSFAYTIAAGQTDANGVSIAANALRLNSGTIKDAAGNNAALSHALVDNNASYLVDTTAPSATLSAGIAPRSGNATVQSSEVGTAYLVKTGGSGSVVTVTNLDSITGAADARWNSVAIAAANTSTSLSLAGLEDGVYSFYTVDAAGNLSAAASNTFTVDSTAPTLSSVTAPATSLSTVSGTTGNSTGETITLTLTFDGPVNGLTSGTNSTIFKVKNSGVTATWLGTAGTASRTLTYTVTQGQNGPATIDEAALKTALVAGISDAAGNAFSYTANGGVIADIDKSPLPTIDTCPPAVTGGEVRYVRIFQDPDNVSQYSLGEVLVMSGGNNLALSSLGAKLKYNTGNYGYGGDATYAPANIIDGDSTTNYLSTGYAAKTGAWVQIDLNGLYTVDQVVVNPRSGSASQSMGSYIFAAATDLSSLTLAQMQAANIQVGRLRDPSGANIFSVATLSYIDTGVNTSDGLTNNATVSIAGLEAGSIWQYSGDGGATWASGTGNSFTLGKGAYSLGQILVKQMDVAGNTGSAGRLGKALTIDLDAPVAMLLNGSAPSSGSATVQSSEVGTAYLVKTGGSGTVVTVTNLVSITGASDALWNSVAIATASTNTSLSLAGLEDGIYSLYTVDAAGNLSAAATGSFTVDTITPLVLDLDGDGVRTTAVEHGVLFDLLATGAPVRTGWTDGHDGLLVLDLNGDGQINDGRELFGNATDTPNGKAADGFAALAQYDLNHDGVIDSQDAVFAKLQVWVDANIDGVTQPSELKSLADLGVASLGLQAQVGTQTDNGNLLGLNASWTDSDGMAHDLVDVFFSASSLQNWVEQATQRLDLAADPQANQAIMHRAADQSTLVVKAGGNDVVRLEDSGWTHAPSEVSIDGHNYGLWVNSGAYLWIDRNATVQQVL